MSSSGVFRVISVSSLEANVFSCQVSVGEYEDICWSKYLKRILFRTLQMVICGFNDILVYTQDVTVYQFYGLSYWKDTSCQCQPPGRCRYPAAELCNMAASDRWKHRSFYSLRARRYVLWLLKIIQTWYF